MEVHHHSGSHPKKKWSEYLLEFFMLFLAVFLGFIAENIREHSIEREREKQYMETLVQDIQLDINDLNTSFDFRIIVEKRIDSLFQLLRKADRQSYMNNIYFLFRRITRARGLSYHNRTIQQLENSGTLRLIRNRPLSDSIILYDTKAKDMLVQQHGEEVLREKIRDRLGNILNIFVVYDMRRSAPDSVTAGINSQSPADANNTFTVKPDSNPRFINNKPEVLNDLLNQVLYLQGHYIVTRFMEKNLIASGNNLIELIKKEYHFK